jgi:signal transduction histidine kinase
MAVPARRIRSQEEEDFSALVLQSIPAAVMVLDSTGRVLFTSEKAPAVLGGKIQNVSEIPSSREFPHEEIAKILSTACREGSAAMRLVTQDRDCRRYFQVCATPLPGSDRTAVLIQELTDLVAQGDLAREFVRQVRHDLRGPLTSMRGAVDLLLTGRVGSLDEKQKRLLGLVEKATHRMTEIVSGSPDAAAQGKGARSGGSGGK